MKTKYRSITVGRDPYLQYLKTFKLFWIIPIRYWVDVPYPYYSYSYGDFLSGDRYQATVSGENAIAKFLRDYPDITDYWPYYNSEMNRKIKEREDALARINSRGETKYYKNGNNS